MSSLFSRLTALVSAAGLVACTSSTAPSDSSTSATTTDVATTPIVSSECVSLTGSARVVCLASAFKATLSATQQSTVQVAWTAANAARWSNLPVSFVPRNGLQFGSLSAAQLGAALGVAQAALSAIGYAQFNTIRAADAYLGTKQSGYGAGLYYIAFLNAPSATGKWMLQLGGHHYAMNIVFNGGAIVSSTPNFIGVEPQTFTLNGTTYAPLDNRKNTMYAMLQSLSTAQQQAALLTQSFDDVLVGPGKDGQFPTQQGVTVSSLSASQQALVKAAIEAWVKDAPDAVGTALLADYESDLSLAQTRIAYSRSTTPTVAGAYVRIDGPRVWIEFASQNGIVIQGQIHFHTIWRDKTSDYGGSISG